MIQKKCLQKGPCMDTVTEFQFLVEARCFVINFLWHCNHKLLLSLGQSHMDISAKRVNCFEQVRVEDAVEIVFSS